VFYEPAFALGHGAGALAWMCGVGSGMVAMQPRRGWVGSLPHGSSAATALRFPCSRLAHPYAPWGSPLVDRVTWACHHRTWLDLSQNDPRLPKTWLLPVFPVESGGPRARHRRCAARRAAVSVYQQTGARYWHRGARGELLDAAQSARRSAKSCGGSASCWANRINLPLAAPAIRPDRHGADDFFAPSNRSSEGPPAGHRGARPFLCLPRS